MSKVRVCANCGNEFTPKHGPCQDCHTFGYYHSTTRIFDEVPRKTNETYGPFYDVVIFDSYKEYHDAVHINGMTPEYSMDLSRKRYLKLDKLIKRLDKEIQNIILNKTLRDTKPHVIIYVFVLAKGTKRTYDGPLSHLDTKKLEQDIKSYVYT